MECGYLFLHKLPVCFLCIPILDLTGRYRTYIPFFDSVDIKISILYIYHRRCTLPLAHTEHSVACTFEFLEDQICRSLCTSFTV
jgi:hypothetical protein